MKIILAFVLVAGAYAQFEGMPLPSGKSVDAPHPPLVEVPYQQPMYHAPASETVHGGESSIPVGAPTLDVPHRFQTVDVPHSPLNIPEGGTHIEDAHMDIPQPVVYMPKPVVQRKPVVFNLPQPIVQIPQPVIRHKPILYTVPHILKLQRPILNHRLEHYHVAPVNVQKSGYGAPVVSAFA